MHVSIAYVGPAADALMGGGLTNGSIVLDHDRKLAFPLNAPLPYMVASWQDKSEEGRAAFLRMAIPIPGLYEAAMSDLDFDGLEPNHEPSEP